MTTTTETPAEALARIQSRVSQNDFAIIHQFYACGVNPEEIIPRVTVLTFKAWKAMGRRVALGASSQRVTVWRPIKKTDKKTGKEKDGMIPTTACLFHISQTIAEDAPKGTRPDAWQNPQLVKAGTYDDAPQQESTTDEQEDSFTPEIVTISSKKKWTEYLTELAPEPAAPTQKTARKQLAMF